MTNEYPADIKAENPVNTTIRFSIYERDCDDIGFISDIIEVDFGNHKYIRSLCRWITSRVGKKEITFSNDVDFGRAKLPESKLIKIVDHLLSLRKNVIDTFMTELSILFPTLLVEQEDGVVLINQDTSKLDHETYDKLYKFCISRNWEIMSKADESILHIVFTKTIQ